MTFLKFRIAAAYAVVFFLFCGLCGVVVHRLITTVPAAPPEAVRVIHDR